MKGLMIMGLLSFLLGASRCSPTSSFQPSDLYYINHGKLAVDAPSVILDTEYSDLQVEVLEVSRINPLDSPRLAGPYRVVQKLVLKVTVLEVQNQIQRNLYVAEGLESEEKAFTKGQKLTLKVGLSAMNVVYGVQVP